MSLINLLLSVLLTRCRFSLLLACVLCSALTVQGQKSRLGHAPEPSNSADYSVQVHITASHVHRSCAGNMANVWCESLLSVDVLVNGKKLELTGTSKVGKEQSVLLIPGEYRARIAKEIKEDNSAVFRQEYDLLLPDGSTWHGATTGITE